jgi:hypothetical protein
MSSYLNLIDGVLEAAFWKDEVLQHCLSYYSLSLNSTYPNLKPSNYLKLPLKYTCNLYLQFNYDLYIDRQTELEFG